MKLKHQCCCNGTTPPDSPCCQVLPNEVLCVTGVISAWANMGRQTPWNQEPTSGDHFTPWTGCSQVPASFIMQRITSTSYDAVWRWNGLTSFYHPRNSDEQFPVRLTAYLRIQGAPDMGPENCQGTFWMGLVNTGVSLDTDEIYGTVPFHLSTKSHWAIFSVSANLGLFGDPVMLPAVQTTGLTEGLFVHSFSCGRGSIRWFSQGHFGLNYFPHAYETGTSDLTVWETEVMTENVYDNDPNTFIPPLCFGQDTKTITFEPV